MSETPMGLMIAEKFFGLLVILIGVIIAYVTYNDPLEGTVSQFSIFFTIVGLILVAIGIFMVLTKTE